MNLTKKLLLSIGFVFLAIQFIQPVHNNSSLVLKTDILKVVSISDSVQNILKNACNDCHSNNTIYPWYSNIQPMGWIMANHITEGKEELNFSEFGSYSPRKQLSKLNGIANSIKDGTMPLTSYKLIHRNSQLTAKEKTIIINWVALLKDNLSGEK